MIHACATPVMKLDTRRDRNWIPPQVEERPRCTSCGWQGSWRVAS